jgi:hypothetical protein
MYWGLEGDKELAGRKQGNIRYTVVPNIALWNGVFSVNASFGKPIRAVLSRQLRLQTPQ